MKMGGEYGFKKNEGRFSKKKRGGCLELQRGQVILRKVQYKEQSSNNGGGLIRNQRNANTRKITWKNRKL